MHSGAHIRLQNVIYVLLHKWKRCFRESPVFTVKIIKQYEVNVPHKLYFVFLCKDTIEDNDCTCDRPRSERWPASVKRVEDMYNTITKFMCMSLGSASCIFHLQSLTPQIICYTIHVFPHRFRRVEIEKKKQMGKISCCVIKRMKPKVQYGHHRFVHGSTYIYFKETLKHA